MLNTDLKIKDNESKITNINNIKNKFKTKFQNKNVNKSS